MTQKQPLIGDMPDTSFLQHAWRHITIKQAIILPSTPDRRLDIIRSDDNDPNKIYIQPLRLRRYRHSLRAIIYSPLMAQ